MGIGSKVGKVGFAILLALKANKLRKEGHGRGQLPDVYFLLDEVRRRPPSNHIRKPYYSVGPSD